MGVSPVNMTEAEHELRGRCAGVVPLHARMEDWMVDVSQNGNLFNWISEFGSPLNVLCDQPFRRNIAELHSAADDRQLDFDVYFARKANKCLQFVDTASEIGCGVDVASEQELIQVLDRDLPASKIVCTAAIKSESLIQLCVDRGVLIVVDNQDEMLIVRQTATAQDRLVDVALRVSGFDHDDEKLYSRFGFDMTETPAVLQQFADDEDLRRRVCLAGLHFHLDGYCPRQRVSALKQTLQLVDQCRELGHAPTFVDMGGGVPMSYLNSQSQWREFWSQHRLAVLGNREPITYRNHELGLTVVNGHVHGRPKSYPYHQSPVRSEWFANILDAEFEQNTLAGSIRRRGIQLRCEPGRSVLDGCGMTVARVEFRKQHISGEWLIGLSMNRTQCRTSSDDFLVDPIVLANPESATRVASCNQPMAGYLVGAYCTESEMLSLRKLQFPYGVEVGDVVVFPNTAGYLMHFLESRSHQFPLGKNVFVHHETGYRNAGLDLIDTQTYR